MWTEEEVVPFLTLIKGETNNILNFILNKGQVLSPW